jgi:hypothetical protein
MNLTTEEEINLQEIYKAVGIDSKYWQQINNAPSDTRVELLDFVESIEMIHWMLQSDDKRGYARDRPRDAKGRIIVDITKPHVLEDMDYFRQSAIHFQKYGKYTNFYPNPHPKSEYKKFWDEETRRCIEGYVRQSDGEWVSGYYYWYLNYFPIMRTEATGEGKRAERIYDFVDVWDSDYLFYHYVEQGESESEYGSVLKTRGRGYSFKISSMLDRNFYLIKKSKGYAFASVSEYLTKDGVLTKAWSGMDFLDENTPWSKLKQKKNTDGHKRASYIHPITGKESGYMSEIMEVTTKGDAEKGRGKRGKLLIHEEAGIYPKLLQTWNIARPSIEDGDFTFGYQICFGTGGSPGSKFEGLEELFYRGGGYKVKMVRNIWDKVKGEGTCGFFVPEYMNRKGCYDQNGNSNVAKALMEILINRKKIRENASKENALTQEKAERPITPQEAVMRIEGSLFPVDDLKSYLETIMPEMGKFVSKHYIGRLNPDPSTGVLSYSPSADDKVIREFPLKDNVNKYGAIEIFKMPITDGMGVIPRFRYYAGIDTYDDDSSTTNSLGSIFIADILTDEIVAEFTGRPKTANEFYEVCLRLLKFYNAIANYENDKKGLFAYFSHRNQLSLLADNPQILKDMELVKANNLYGNKAKGTNSGVKINAWGRRLQADWMLESAYNEESKGLLNLHKIRSIGYLKESIAWNEDGNFDRVSAMGMLMILREEYKKYKLQVSEQALGTKIKNLANDSFFDLNFGLKDKIDPKIVKAFGANSYNILAEYH